MRMHWKRVVFAPWLLTLMLGFAVAAASGGVRQELLPCLGWEQNQAGNHGHDAGF